MRITTLVLVCGLMAAACERSAYVPNWDGYEAQLQALHGTQLDQVVLDWGAPDKTTELAAGSRAFVWEHKATFKTADRVELRENGRGVTGEVYRGQDVGVTCTTTLLANAEGIITGHKAEGAGCVGLAPSEAGSGPPAAPAAAPAVPTPAAETAEAGGTAETQGDAPDDTEPVEAARATETPDGAAGEAAEAQAAEAAAGMIDPPSEGVEEESRSERRNRRKRRRGNR